MICEAEFTDLFASRDCVADLMTSYYSRLESEGSVSEMK